MNTDEIRKLAAQMREYAAKVELLAVEPDPYAELKKAHAEGKVIQFYSDQRGQWIDAEDPGFFGFVQGLVMPCTW